MSQVTRQIVNGNEDLFPIKPTEYDKFLVISIGTGSHKAEKMYTAQEVSKWGIFSWLTANNSNPIIDIFGSGSADMVDIHLAVLFEALKSEKSYLRIQVNYLSCS